jgi:hypothetical protein
LDRRASRDFRLPSGPERASRWVAAIYFIIALATPFLLYRA